MKKMTDVELQILELIYTTKRRIAMYLSIFFLHFNFFFKLLFSSSFSFNFSHDNSCIYAVHLIT